MTFRRLPFLPLLLAVVSLLAGALPAWCADLATWTLNGVITSGNPVAVTSTAPNVSAGNLALSPTLASTAFINAFVGDGWPLAAAADPTRYFEFSVSATGGYAISFSQVLFTLYNNHAGTTAWELRSAADGFIAPLAQGSATTLVGIGTHVTANVSGLGTRVGTVTFRFYTYNNTGDTEPDQRGFHGSAAGGQDLNVQGTVLGPTGVPDGREATALRLAPIVPNPVVQSAAITFTLPSSGHVELMIFDAQGRLVRTLLAADRAAGEHATQWDGLTDVGIRAVPGVYLASLKSGSVKSVRRVVLLR